MGGRRSADLHAKRLSALIPALLSFSVASAETSPLSMATSKSIAPQPRPVTTVPKFGCVKKRRCKEMHDCEEAISYFQRCGSPTPKSGDIPCISTVCRQGFHGWEARLKLNTALDKSWQAPLEVYGALPFLPNCHPKKYCKQMSTCAEARFRLTICGDKRLDADDDGVPCENVCK